MSSKQFHRPLTRKILFVVGCVTGHSQKTRTTILTSTFKTISDTLLTLKSSIRTFVSKGTISSPFVTKRQMSSLRL